MSKSFKIFIAFIAINALVSLFIFAQKNSEDIETGPALAIETIKVVSSPEPIQSEIQNNIVENAELYLSAVLSGTKIATNSNQSTKYNDKKTTQTIQPYGTVKYTGVIQHIFFHSLIIYPEKAASDSASASSYDDYMITRDQFEIILQQLYDANFVLIDSRDLYSVESDGSISKQSLYLPAGKKALILSLDDLSYYNYMKDGGFANRLVLQNGKIQTEVITPEGETVITNDGDVVPIVDSFVERHPDFSWQGAKGIIALTGYEGVLGYNTNNTGVSGSNEKSLVKPIIQALKNTGWIFANHSYSHGASYRKNTISENGLAKDISRWLAGTGLIVGETDIFIGPFGQVFQEGDSRRKQLIEAGFPILYGVGLNPYLEYFGDHMVMDRVDIDGYRIRNNPGQLKRLLGIDTAEL
ncbi:MAG: hypothetical protein ACI88L_000488 [Candidatus Paceibacteria bacterium]|jgi:hypothetical protein